MELVTVGRSTAGEGLENAQSARLRRSGRFDGVQGTPNVQRRLEAHTARAAVCTIVMGVFAPRLDATATGALLGSFTATSLGSLSVPLSAVDLTDLVTTGGFVGLRFQGPSEPVNIQLDSIQDIFGGAPALQIDIIPEPTSIGLLALGGILALIRRTADR